MSAWTRIDRASFKPSRLLVTLLVLLASWPIAAIVPPATPAHAASFTVTTNVDNGANTGSLRYAVDHLVPGGNTIDLGPAVSGQTITLSSGELALGHDVTIRNTSGGTVAVSGNHSSRVFRITNNATVSLQDFTVRDGLAPPDPTIGRADGGGMLVEIGSSLTLTRMIVDSNTARGADGVVGNAFANPEIPSTGGKAGTGGGVFNAGTLTVSNRTFSGNRAEGGNGGSDPFKQKPAGGGGGFGAGLFNTGSATISASTFVDNLAQGGTGGDGTSGAGGGGGLGGAIFQHDTPAAALLSVTNVTLSGSRVRGGAGGKGGTGSGSGALGQVGSDGGFGEGGGSSGGDGGFGGGSGTASGGGSPGRGGFGGGGGGRASPGGTGGGSGGTAAGSAGGGGGIGAGLFVNGSTAIVASGTIVMGTASGGSGGAGGAPGFPGSGLGGGIYRRTGTLNLRANIVGDNTASTSAEGTPNSPANGPDVNGTVASKGYNLIEDPTTASGLDPSTDITGLDPGLRPLALNPSGVTKTHALDNGSPAIDAGPPSGCVDAASAVLTVDQRGQSRPSGLRCDIGAYERQGGVLQLSSATYGVDEDDGTVTLSVRRTGGAEGTVGATFSTADGTAKARSDYTAVSTTVSFGDGVEGVANLPITIANDSLNEANETIILSLTSPTGGAALGAQATAVVTIQDDDPVPTLSVGDVTVAEGSSGTVNADFTFSLSAASGRTVTVNVQTADNTALAGTDFTAAGPTQITFPASSTSQSFTVAVLGDTLDEPDRQFFVSLASPSNASVARAQGIGTIQDNDSGSTLSIDDATLAEGQNGSTNAVFTVTLSPSSGRTVTVVAQAANGTATAGSDYTATGPTTLTFNPGDTSRTFSVPVLGDTVAEGNETFTVTLSGQTNAGLAKGQGSGTIVDDDGATALTIGDATVTEGNSGSARLTFTVLLAPASASTVTVNYATADLSATTADNDYAATSGTLTFNPGETSKTLDVTVNGDTKAEGSETFTVTLISPTNASLAKAQGAGTIVNDDPGSPPPGTSPVPTSSPSLAINDVSVVEGSSGTTNATFAVTLSPASSQPVTVVAQTANGTAQAGTDYTATGPITQTFSPGVTTQTFTVPILGDATAEPDETVLVNLSNPTNATIGKATGTGTIVNDDADGGVVAIVIHDVSVAEGNSATTGAAFAVELNRVSHSPVTVQFATADGTATTADGDYQAASGTLTFAPGELSKTVTVIVRGDTKAESDETFTVTLSNPTNAELAKAQAVGTIVDDDAVTATACSPRPPVGMATRSTGDGRLAVTVTAGTQGPNGANRLTELRFGAGTNALVDVAGQTGRPGAFSVALPDKPASLTFFVRRATPGQATSLPFTVVDSCGPWPTLVGGGPGAF